MAEKTAQSDLTDQERAAKLARMILLGSLPMGVGFGLLNLLGKKSEGKSYPEKYPKNLEIPYVSDRPVTLYSTKKSEWLDPAARKIEDITRGLKEDLSSASKKILAQPVRAIKDIVGTVSGDERSTTDYPYFWRALLMGAPLFYAGHKLTTSGVDRLQRARERKRLEKLEREYEELLARERRRTKSSSAGDILDQFADNVLSRLDTMDKEAALDKYKYMLAALALMVGGAGHHMGYEYVKNRDPLRRKLKAIERASRQRALERPTRILLNPAEFASPSEQTARHREAAKVREEEVDEQTKADEDSFAQLIG